MHITKKSGYGLIAMMELADREGGEEEFISTAEISDKYNLPRPFLEKIMGELRKGELVEVKRGRGGGYGLKEEPSSITVRQIVAALDGNNLAPVSCLGNNGKGDCPLESFCPALGLWEDVQNRLDDILTSYSLQDLLENGKFE